MEGSDHSIMSILLRQSSPQALRPNTRSSWVGRLQSQTMRRASLRDLDFFLDKSDLIRITKCRQGKRLMSRVQAGVNMHAQQANQEDTACKNIHIWILFLSAHCKLQIKSSSIKPLQLNQAKAFSVKICKAFSKKKKVNCIKCKHKKLLRSFQLLNFQNDLVLFL